MKKEVASIIIGVFIVLVSFQNCQKPPYPDEINNLAAGVAVANANKIDLNREVIRHINFIVQNTAAVTKAGNTYQINYNQTLQIDLGSGEIAVSSDLDSATANYCLTEPLKNELVSILKSSQVCNKHEVLPEGTACTQVMKMPYAQLVTSREQYDLGSATDGCGSNSIDLCEDQPSFLKAYIELIKQQYQSLRCP